MASRRPNGHAPRRVTVIVDHDVDVPMRDGCMLRATVYRPAEGRHPALVLRTPYNKNLFQTTHTSLDPLRAAAAGYVVVLQDVRGRFASEGDRFEPYLDDFDDGYDTVEWAARQPFSNGEVGAYGVSYLGGTAWWIAAACPPSLRAIAPTQSPNDLFVNLAWRGGAFMLGQHLWWSLATIGPSAVARRDVGRPDVPDRIAALVDRVDGYEALAHSMPLRTLLADLPDGQPFPYFEDLMSHATRDDYYEPRSTLHRHDRVAVPALIVAGWYDVLLGNDLDHYGSLLAEAATAQAREQSRLVIGPWSHGVGVHASAVGQLDFGLRAGGMSIDLREDLTTLHLRWFDRWLRDGDADDQPPVKLFVMGRNRWRDEDRWPLARARTERWHLAAQGRLTPEPPGADAPPTAYVYDPQDPCPTLGGNLLMPLNYQRGPVDQTAIMDRRDVLVFRSDPLADELEVTGRVSAILFAATSAPDTDWVVKLCDAHPDGRTFNVCDGILRARYHGGDWTAPSPVEPGAVVRYEVDLWATSMVFKAGHRICVLVTSSDFPRYDRNPNTGELGVDATTTTPALQRIYCDAQSPSCVVLPIVG